MSSWELNIDPKRLQETIRNDFEGAKPRRSGKKDINARKRDQKERRKGAQKAKGSERGSPLASIWMPNSAPKRPPKSTQEESMQASKRSQDHLRIGNLDFSRHIECIS